MKKIFFVFLLLGSLLMPKSVLADELSIKANDDITFLVHGENKIVHLTLEYSGTLTYYFSAENISNEAFSYKVYNSNNLVISEYGNIYGFGKNWYETKALRDGDYYFAFDCKGDVQIGIKTEFTASDDTIVETANNNNDTFENANTITLGKTYKASVSADEDYYDYYKFEILHDKTIIHLNNNVSFNGVDAKLYNADKQRVYVTLQNNIDSYIYEELDKGTYYLLMESNYCDSANFYSFSVSEKYFGWGWNWTNDKYWYENGYRQAMYGDPKNNWYDGTERGREIYDPVSNGWYWLDSIYDGAKAANKEVFMPYIYQDEDNWDADTIAAISMESDTYTETGITANMSKQVENAILDNKGKWVRYDWRGKMIKGWYKVAEYENEYYPYQVGNVYYYDYKTGLMAKGETIIDGITYFFDPVSGVCENPPEYFSY